VKEGVGVTQLLRHPRHVEPGVDAAHAVHLGGDVTRELHRTLQDDGAATVELGL
jgi:hypothetical protein